MGEFSQDRAGASLVLQFKDAGSLCREADSWRSYPGYASAEVLVRLLRFWEIAICGPG